MARDELREKLFTSEAVTSLLSESQLAEILRIHGWEAVHGFYYEDVETGKHREVDVSATRRWVVGTYGERYIFDTTTVNIVIECKSARESHLVFSDFVPPFKWFPEL